MRDELSAEETFPDITGRYPKSTPVTFAGMALAQSDCVIIVFDHVFATMGQLGAICAIDDL